MRSSLTSLTLPHKAPVLEPSTAPLFPWSQPNTKNQPQKMAIFLRKTQIIHSRMQKSRPLQSRGSRSKLGFLLPSSQSPDLLFHLRRKKSQFIESDDIFAILFPSFSFLFPSYSLSHAYSIIITKGRIQSPPSQKPSAEGWLYPPPSPPLCLIMKFFVR